MSKEVSRNKKQQQQQTNINLSVKQHHKHIQNNEDKKQGKETTQ